MRIFLILVVAVGSLWAIDVFALDSRYSSCWQRGQFSRAKIGSRNAAVAKEGQLLIACAPAKIIARVTPFITLDDLGRRRTGSCFEPH